MKDKETNNGDLEAFACCNSEYLQGGLTKREYFAGLALQGLCTPCIAGSHNCNMENHNTEKAVHAVALADALLESLKN